MIEPQELIRLLGLQPHPAEGGYFVETYRSTITLPPGDLPGGGSGSRSLATAIYYLLTPETFSALHRLPTDEIFHFYLGDPAEMLQLRPDGTGTLIHLGCDLAAGQRPQVVVRRDTWQGTRLLPGGRFALLGTTMAPGFDSADYTPGEREALIVRYPEFRERITSLTR